MGKTVINKKAEIYDLLKEFKEFLVNIQKMSIIFKDLKKNLMMKIF